MYGFSFDRASSVQDAAAKAANGGQLLAGGQTLLASMKQRLASPETLVDLSGIADLKGICKDGNAMVVGAMTRHQEVATNKELIATIAGLARLAGGIGDRQVRAMGTIGGSVANNDPAACYPSAVLGLGATIKTNKREIAADKFFQGLFTTALEPGEMILSIRFPIPKASAYAKFKQPASRYALLGVFVAQTDSGVRVAVTGGGNGVVRHAGLEAALSKSFSPSAVDGVTVSASEFTSDLHASAEYRAQLLKVQTKRAVHQALGNA
ncbi:MAG: xanthine dehydrogenase family protein subunit M [Burkholderiaceae bacterium]|nr:xanthine dehydrogenase family protein subunit M [Burkholderiaceae bacterium]